MYIFDFWSKIDGICSRQEKSIWPLLVTIQMIYDFAIVWWLLWGSGRAARQDDTWWNHLSGSSIIKLYIVFICWTTYWISIARIPDDRRQPRFTMADAVNLSLSLGHLQQIPFRKKLHHAVIHTVNYGAGTRNIADWVSDSTLATQSTVWITA